MIQELYDLIEIAKIVILGIGGIGLVLLLIGIYKKRREFMTRGGYLLVLAIVLWVCGYFILTTSKKRAYEIGSQTYFKHR